MAQVGYQGSRFIAKVGIYLSRFADVLSRFLPSFLDSQGSTCGTRRTYLGSQTMLQFIQRLINRRDNEKGASAVEYGLLVAAIAAIIVLIVFAIGKFVKAGFSDTCNALDANSTAAATC